MIVGEEDVVPEDSDEGSWNDVFSMVWGCILKFLLLHGTGALDTVGHLKMPKKTTTQPLPSLFACKYSSIRKEFTI